MTATGSGTRSTVLAIVLLLRPREWLKNAFVFAPLLFAGAFVHRAAIRDATLAFVIFCIASSAVYVLNDIRDIDEDRRHPVKSRTRPLAAGRLGVPTAIAVLVLLYAMVAGAWLWEPTVSGVALFYLALNVAHTFVLKRQPVVDIFSIAIGFVLRVYAGAEAIAVPVSSWMFVTTLCLALYLAAVKRRQEFNWTEGTGREVLKLYTAPLLDRFAQTAATCALVFYSLFVMSARPDLVFSIPIVLFGLFRYAWLVECRKAGESPAETLVGDGALLATIVVWLATCAWVIVRAPG